MEALIYIANMLYLASYFMQDILRLRALTITAAMCLVGYFYLRPEPLMTVVWWNLFFVALNAFHISRVLTRRRARRPSLNAFRKRRVECGKNLCASSDLTKTAPVKRPSA